ncbi:CBS domain-containing protein [Candidatus Peregrinibacteria bacterium]|nr:CBS domain-containing protein [Candidatus Peregrinibacteria bacterium]
MLIKDLLEKHYVTINKDTTWLEALKAMEKHDTNGLFVIDKHGKYLGIVTIAELISFAIPPYMKEDPDLTKSAAPETFLKLCEEKKNAKVKEFMNKNKPFYRPHTKLIEIVAITLNNDSYRLPVVDKEGKLIGVVNRRHIRDALGEHFKLK